MEKRNKKTHYGKDIHIRISDKYFELIKQEAKELQVPTTWLVRIIIEKYFKEKEKEN